LGACSASQGIDPKAKLDNVSSLFHQRDHYGGATMRGLMTKVWWTFLLRGVLLGIFAVLALASPVVTAAALIFWIAIFLVAEGGFIFLAAIMGWKEGEDKWLSVVEGVLNVILGIFMLGSPEVTIFFAVFYLGIWSVMSGVTRIAMAIQLRKEIKGDFWIALSGTISILFGLLIISNPGVGAATLVRMLGLFALLAGIILIVFGFKMKKLAIAVG
jgi:uncharacterized membrane protein HdeD (DUF308 family)